MEKRERVHKKNTHTHTYALMFWAIWSGFMEMIHGAIHRTKVAQRRKQAPFLGQGGSGVKQPLHALKQKSGKWAVPEYIPDIVKYTPRIRRKKIQYYTANDSFSTPSVLYLLITVLVM